MQRVQASFLLRNEGEGPTGVVHGLDKYYNGKITKGSMEGDAYWLGWLEYAVGGVNRKVSIIEVKWPTGKTTYRITPPSKNGNQLDPMVKNTAKRIWKQWGKAFLQNTSQFPKGTPQGQRAQYLKHEVSLDLAHLITKIT